MQAGAFPDRRMLAAVLATLVPDWQPTHVHLKAHLPGGYSHGNFRVGYAGEDYVLRMPATGARPEDLAFEAEWLHSLPAGLGVDIVAYDPASGSMLSRWLDAPLLAERDAGATSLLDYLVTLHQRLPPTARGYDLPARIDRWLGRAPQPRPVSRARSVLASPQATDRTSHNDLNPWNILCSADGWRTLDWEWVGTNQPLFDLVTLGLGAGLEPAVLLTMAGNYLERMRLPLVAVSSRVEQAIGSFWLREYAWACHALREGNTRSEVVAQFDTALQRLADITTA